MIHSKYTKTFIATVVATSLNTALAQKSVGHLPEIVVYSEQNHSLNSSQIVNQDKMKKTPATNGNITDYLRDNPHVRYANSDQDGFQRGEIKPENISINGADSNQTAYFMDNVNVNNELSIDSDIFDSAMQVIPSINHTQAYFFDANMLSKVEVQDSNISASLGGFMGGAVVAKTKQYDGNVVDENFDPLYDYEKGGYGDSQLTQQNIHYSTEYALEPFSWGNTNHSISVGGLYQASFYAFNRDQYVNAQIGFVEIGSIMLTPMEPTPKGPAKTSYQNIALYGEDLVKWKDLEVRLGLRFERNDYLKNNNLAPRFVAKYQPWSKTSLTQGLNRYYGVLFLR